MDYGFVTGLPRSGSAWLANYLSYSNCCFLHDPWKRMTPLELKGSLTADDVYAGGSCDSGNLLLIDEIDKVFPDAKWVLITRPESEVHESCKSLNFPWMDYGNQLKKLSSRKVLKVPFSQIFDRADEIGRYIYKDFECPPWRNKMLKDLNVQLHWGNVSKQFKFPDVLKQVDPLTSSKIAYYDLISEICNKDPYAIRFLSQARDASELYRQLSEGKHIDIEKAKDTLEAMATEWTTSPFVRTYFASLTPAIISCLEKYRAKDMAHCPVDLELVSAVTYIMRSNEGVKEYMPKVRELSDKILKEKR